MAAMLERGQNILTRSVVTIEKPDIGDAQRRDCGTSFNLADVSKGSCLLRTDVVVSTASGILEYHGDTLMVVMGIWSGLGGDRRNYGRGVPGARNLRPSGCATTTRTSALKRGCASSERCTLVMRCDEQGALFLSAATLCDRRRRTASDEFWHDHVGIAIGLDAILRAALQMFQDVVGGILPHFRHWLTNRS